MIFIANNADFSANNLGQIPLYSIEDVSQSTLDFLGHYTTGFTDEQKFAVHMMLTNLGYGNDEGLFNKLTTIIFPFLSNSVEEAFLNAVDWSDITTRPYSATKDKFTLAEGVLKDTAGESNIAVNSSAIPNMSFGAINCGAFSSTGGNNNLSILFDNVSKNIVWSMMVEGIPSYRKTIFSDTNFCVSANSSELLISDNVISTTFDEDESYIGKYVNAIQGMSIQYLRFSANNGASSIFVGEALTQSEINAVLNAIKSCEKAFINL